MSTPYATIYTKLAQASIPQAVAEKAAAGIMHLDQTGRFCGLQMAQAFIMTYRANANTALQALETTVRDATGLEVKQW